MAIKTIPSLVIGLGGTGKRALTHLKRRILDTYHRDDLPWVRLLSLDTDDGAVSNPPIISQYTGEAVQLGISEMRVIDQSDTPKIIANLDSPENRHIRDWYPDPGMNIDFPKAAKGSGQVRMFGRVGLYKGDNLHTTYRWLQQAAQEVSDPAAWDDFRGFDIDPGTQFIYVICSLCGGTGSGMFLDVAYMLRKIVGVDPSTRRFIGMFVMPEVYEPVVENQHLKRIYANSYAALRELDFLMNNQQRSYKIRGKDHTFVDFERDVTPFDFTFLLSNKNKRGAVISQRQVNADKPVAADDRICQYISEVMMTDVLSPVTERNESILSNIFTSLGDPEQLEGRTLHKSYSSVAAASVKVPPLSSFEDMLKLKISDVVIDFLLRPDPDITERALAKQFFTDSLGKAEEQLTIRGSLSNDANYSRFRTKAFKEEIKINRQAALNTVKQWIENCLKETCDKENPLDVEKPEINAYKDMLARFSNSLNSTIRSYAHDPRHGYTFITEWLEELANICRSKQAQVPPPRHVDGDPRRGCREALESLGRVGMDLQLPLMKDTMTVAIERVADYYDDLGREGHTNDLIRTFYEEAIKIVESSKEKLSEVSRTLHDLCKKTEQDLNVRISNMPDISSERVLIDKSMIGRKEIEKFLNFLLGPIWSGGDWKATVPALSDELQQRINAELSFRLLEISSEPFADDQIRIEKMQSELNAFVKQRVFDQLFPVDPTTGRIKEPSYTDSEGKSIIFDFGPDNLLHLMLAHSSPLWFVQTHQVASATSPITFIGLNGTKVPDGFVEEVQKTISTFRPSDLVLSDAEPRIVVKQYDPMYSLASLATIVDYENFYRATDRKQNPLHTDIRFAAEPNAYLQWLSYKSVEPPRLKLCTRGHDITRALSELRQFCPDCFRDGTKTFIVQGKVMCPKCTKVIEEGSRKCPECLSILEVKKVYCLGCMASGKSHPEVISIPPNEHGPVNCPACGSLWSSSCPYCSAPLERSTVCTKGADRCIFDSPPIALCNTCSCPVTPDTANCPRCFKALRECLECNKHGEAKRMLPKDAQSCPICNSRKDLVGSKT